MSEGQENIDSTLGVYTNVQSKIVGRIKLCTV